MNLKTGDILICKGSSWISKAIMVITKGTYSHTALFVQVCGKDGIIEAQKNGVNFKTFTTWLRKWNYEYIVFRPLIQKKDTVILTKAFAVCGETKYDLFTFFRRAFGSRKKRSESKENEKFICSEFTAYIHDLPEGYDMTPQEQYEWLKNNPNWVQIIK